MGRTLKDCGEDLLVEISEILFNELAFFRLMQELDSGGGGGGGLKHKSKKTNELTDRENHSPKVSIFSDSLGPLFRRFFRMKSLKLNLLDAR